MRGISLRKKVICTFLVGMLASMAVLILLSGMLVRPVFIWDSENMMKRYAVQIEEELNKEDGMTGQLLEDIYNEYLIRGIVVGNDREILYRLPGNKMDEQALERVEQLLDNYRKRNTQAGLISLTNEDEQLRRLLYIRETDDGTCIILSKSIKGIEQDVRLVSYFLMFLVGILAVVMTLVWVVLTGPFVRSIKKMSIVTKKMADLDFTEKVSYKWKDEVGVLADSVNRLSDDLSSHIDEMQEEVERRKALVRNLSHELRTPVTTIRGYAENIKFLLPDHEKVNRYCDIMMEECDSVAELSRELLGLAQIESGENREEWVPVVMAEFSKKLSAECSHYYSDHLVDCQLQEGIIQANPFLLQRAVLNLVENAVKYGDGKGIRILGTAEEGNYVFSVHNTGKKISEDVQKNIWDVFYKENKARTRDRSFGLGLSLVKQIALRHGGGVAVNSSEEETVFSFWISAVYGNRTDEKNKTL